MRYLINNSNDPYHNMAFDEFALQSLELDEPVFFLWQNRPAVIIGLNQNPYAEVDLDYLKANNIDLVRRVTGGGAVYHDFGNVNYTICGRSRDLDADYPGYLHIVRDALQGLGVDAELSGRNDILVDGKKCSGYAKRVFKDRLMIHGTLMFDVDLQVLTKALSAPGSKLTAAGVASVRSRVTNLKPYLPQFDNVAEFTQGLFDILRGDSTEVELTAQQRAAIEAEADAKFRTWEWIFGRSPKAEVSKTEKFACGRVSASFSVVHGCISSLSFGGDFIGNLPSEELAAALEGCRYDKTAILEALSKHRLTDYFDGITADELAGLLD